MSVQAESRSWVGGRRRAGKRLRGLAFRLEGRNKARRGCTLAGDYDGGGRLCKDGLAVVLLVAGDMSEAGTGVNGGD